MPNHLKKAIQHLPPRTKAQRRLAVFSLAVCVILISTLLVGRRSAQSTSHSLLEALRNDGRFGALTAAVDRAELATLLRDHGPFTLFAPTDAALARYDLGQLNQTQLRQLLLYHLVQGAYERPLLATQGSLRTALGVNISISSDAVLNGSVRLAGDPLRAANGVIYQIDAVLMPPPGYFTLTPAAPVAQPAPTQPAAPPPPVAPPPPTVNGNAVDPAIMPFNGTSFNRSVLDAHSALRALGGALDGNRAEPTHGCEAYLAPFFRLANAPFYIEVPAANQTQVEQYEAALNTALNTSEPFVLYCLEGGTFSEFNFGLARHGIDQAAAILEPLYKGASGFGPQ